jgi:alkylation response protein AidB-like acyl-CoA dehydrogenase
MSAYHAPVADMRFVIEEIAGLAEVAALPGHGDATPDLVAHILDEAGRFAGEVLAPLNRSGDVESSRLENGVVRTPAGFADAYGRFVASGWNAVPFDPEHGGQGLPWSVAIALQEMWNAANMSFALCPLLTQGAVELLQAHGSAAQKATYLAPLVEGRWTGTMNLTEPQAGTDLAAIRTRAVRAKEIDGGDGYRVIGQKIFITYGEHDLAENIVHMVLARSPDGPPGVKGLSLFIVPKFLPDTEGKPGRRNDVRVLSIEHKLGIKASPTCVMAYGEDGGATAYLVGEENRGVEYMFTMMNNARLSVGVQGLAIAERAWQQARSFAEARVQSRAAGGGKEAVAIIRHPDVRRMLMTMRSLTDAMRGLVYDAAGTLDRAKRHPDAAARARAQARVDLLIPVVKGWCTDQGVAVASLGIQVHGGMGFIEETGAAQHLRDARIAPIYEGTNGIQANDLVGRKLMRDEGAAARAFMAEIAETVAALEAGGEGPRAIAARLKPAHGAMTRATDWLLATMPRDVDLTLAGASPYLALCGTVMGGWSLARQALAAQSRAANGDAGNRALLDGKMAAARFYADNLLPMSDALATQVTDGGATTLAFTSELFAGGHG